MTDAQRVDVERLRAVMALLNQGAMLNEAGEPCAAGHFFGKYQTEAADFLRDNAEGIAALLQQLAELQKENATLKDADLFQAGVEQERELIAAESKLAAQAAEIERISERATNCERLLAERCAAFNFAERAREEACRMIAELRDYVVNERDAQVLPRKAASYQRELDSIDAFLAANGEQHG